MWLSKNAQFLAANVAVYVFVLLCGNCVVDCRRSGGGSRSSGGYRGSSHSSWSGSRPSYSHPSYSSPSSHPSPASLSYPTHHVPSPSSSSNSRPIGWSVPSAPSVPKHSAPTHAAPPSYGFNSHSPSSSSSGHAANPPSYGFKPSAPPAPSAPVASNAGHGANPPSYGFKPSAPPAPSAPVGSNAGHGSNPPVGPPTHVQPMGSSSNVGTHSGSTSAGSNPPAYGWKPSAPVGPPTNARPVGNTPPGAPYSVHPPAYTPHNPGVPPPAYNPAHNPAGYGPPPAYNPAYASHAYPQQQGYGGYPGQYYHAAPGVTNININNINTNTHHHSGGYGYGYGGGYGGGFSYPSYHYSSNEVGSGTLGFFLGYSLAKITTPTYHYHSLYDGYTPRYDHYEVHHYYHNKDSVPAQSTIQPNTIIGCIGDSGTICPTGTTSLCTNNGAILCVASATTTVPCSDGKQGNCVRTTVPCVNGTGGCQEGQNQTLTIPCISKADVPGNITYINNTIIVNQTTIINNNGTTLQNETTVSAGNLTQVAVDALHSLDGNFTSDGTRAKRAVPAVPMNEFCVTILALPAERKPSEQQEVLKKSTGIFANFLVKALGIP